MSKKRKNTLRPEDHPIYKEYEGLYMDLIYKKMKKEHGEQVAKEYCFGAGRRGYISYLKEFCKDVKCAAQSYQAVAGLYCCKEQKVGNYVVAMLMKPLTKNCEFYLITKDVFVQMDEIDEWDMKMYFESFNNIEKNTVENNDILLERFYKFEMEDSNYCTYVHLCLGKYAFIVTYDSYGKMVGYPFDPSTYNGTVPACLVKLWKAEMYGLIQIKDEISEYKSSSLAACKENNKMESTVTTKYIHLRKNTIRSEMTQKDNDVQPTSQRQRFDIVYVTDKWSVRQHYRKSRNGKIIFCPARIAHRRCSETHPELAKHKITKYVE
ncbi:hypothetical protein [Fibrobacter sp. UWH1]|uniref:hypothetical protein n=1 Tax=Fibrobacter sp. UWH1 TaxID=1964354 RepID=UPI000B523022|nr:hypothetical protein [Fibrobacter sp. UWH1]OWV15573.1 hypothetical protein B7992_04095 [Fibrobacter sp. UWH1]